MDEADDVADSAPSNTTVPPADSPLPISLQMPESTSVLLWSANGQCVEFPANRMTQSCPVFAPQVLKGLYAIDDVTRAHKRAVAVTFTLPMIVSASPAAAFCARKTSTDPRKQHVMPRINAYQSWFWSACNLRQLVYATSGNADTTVLVPLHSSVTPAVINKHFDRFERQLEAYEVDVFAPAIRACETPDAFVSVLEACGFFYLHTCEQYLFSIAIEPHCGALLKLEDVLTPRKSFPISAISAAMAQRNALQNARDFFTFKLEALREQYSDEFPSISPPQSIGDSGTLADYWRLCKYIYPPQ